VGLFAGCIVASAQQPVKTWKIGVLVSSTQALNTARDEALRQGLRDLGYEEARTLQWSTVTPKGRRSVR